MKKVLFIGLSVNTVKDIRHKLNIKSIHHEVIPKIKLINGELFVDHPNISNFDIQIDIVVFHGIFENDFDTINALALWPGNCLPSPMAMLNNRLKLPSLARALKVTKFGMSRGFIANGSVSASSLSVAKWGNWHCGKNKEKFMGERSYSEATVIEPFIDGTATRILIIGDKHWQINLEGNNWLKSIHHADSSIISSIDQELLEDTRNLKKHFDIEWIAVDYMVAKTGEKYFLEVNHIPNIDRFPEVEKDYICFIREWLKAAIL